MSFTILAFSKKARINNKPKEPRAQEARHPREARALSKPKKRQGSTKHTSTQPMSTILKMKWK